MSDTVPGAYDDPAVQAAIREHIATLPAPEPTNYRVTYERIGRNHNVAPQTVTAVDLDALTVEIVQYARPHLGSRDVDAYILDGSLTGAVLAGVRNAGCFQIEVLSGGAPDA